MNVVIGNPKSLQPDDDLENPLWKYGWWWCFLRNILGIHVCQCPCKMDYNMKFYKSNVNIVAIRDLKCKCFLRCLLMSTSSLKNTCNLCCVSTHNAARIRCTQYNGGCWYHIVSSYVGGCILVRPQRKVSTIFQNNSNCALFVTNIKLVICSK